MKLIELKTAIDYLERHLNIAKELEDIFEENKRVAVLAVKAVLSYFVAFEEHIADKCLAKPSRSLLLTALYSLQYPAFT